MHSMLCVAMYVLASIFVHCYVSEIIVIKLIRSSVLVSL